MLQTGHISPHGYNRLRLRRAELERRLPRPRAAEVQRAAATPTAPLTFEQALANARQSRVVKAAEALAAAAKPRP